MTDIWQHHHCLAHFPFPYLVPPSRLLSSVNAPRDALSKLLKCEGGAGATSFPYPAPPSRLLNAPGIATP